MANRFTENAQGALNAAPKLASKLGHNYIGSEHILLGIVFKANSIASRLLEVKGVDYKKLEEAVVKMIGVGDSGTSNEFELTPRTKHIIEESGEIARGMGSAFVGTEHILMALLRETDSVAVKLLETLGAEPSSLYNEIIEGMGAKQGASSYSQGANGAPVSNKEATATLDKYATDLTKKAKDGKIDPVIGRDEEMQRVVQILSRRTKNNPCLIGEPGVGKTAVIEGLKALKEPCIVTVVTDSQYVSNGITLGWAKSWKANNWKKKDKKPALNPELWDELLKLVDEHEVTFNWIRGHAGHPENERCDELAVEQSKKYSQQ